MDTPQLTAATIDHALDALHEHDAVLGPAADGGYWLVGVHDVRRNVFRGVPMSTAWTGRAQYVRLRSEGWRVALLEMLVDVDDFESARLVAALGRSPRFARYVEMVEDELGAGVAAR
jgi:glycosyltransferase A (GT-A) superfamily protein (DUF2064 family)